MRGWFYGSCFVFLYRPISIYWGIYSWNAFKKQSIFGFYPGSAYSSWTVYSGLPRVSIPDCVIEPIPFGVISLLFGHVKGVYFNRWFIELNTSCRTIQLKQPYLTSVLWLRVKVSKVRIRRRFLCSYGCHSIIVYVVLRFLLFDCG